MQVGGPPVTQTLANIPEGRAGVVATLKAMRDFVRSSKKSLRIRTLALQIVGGVAGKNWAGELAALHDWVRDNIRFVRDATDVEMLHDAERVLQFGAGDCDDKSILFCSLAESIGHPTRFVAIGFSPGTYEHVYSETLVGRAWIPSDTTEPVPFGWAAPDPVTKLIIYN
jgi:transglutaminase-like putative cysteine protease